MKWLDRRRERRERVNQGDYFGILRVYSTRYISTFGSEQLPYDADIAFEKLAKVINAGIHRGLFSPAAAYGALIKYAAQGEVLASQFGDETKITMAQASFASKREAFTIARDELIAPNVALGGVAVREVVESEFIPTDP